MILMRFQFTVVAQPVAGRYILVPVLFYWLCHQIGFRTVPYLATLRASCRTCTYIGHHVGGID